MNILRISKWYRLLIVVSVTWIFILWLGSDGDMVAFLGGGVLPVVLLWEIIWVIKGFRKKDDDSKHTSSDLKGTGMMNLDEFITNSLLGIKHGIEGANDDIDSYSFGIGMEDVEQKEGYIEYEIAVTAGEETKEEGEGKVNLKVVDLGAGVKDTATKEHVSRIKFYIRIMTQM